MSRARHKMNKGGGVKPVWNAGGEQNAAKEALERKRGGKVEHMEGEGEKPKHRHDRAERKRGGKAEHEKHRAKGGRVKGEGVGANLTPLSTAARIKEAYGSNR